MEGFEQDEVYLHVFHSGVRPEPNSGKEQKAKILWRLWYGECMSSHDGKDQDTL